MNNIRSENSFQVIRIGWIILLSIFLLFPTCRILLIGHEGSSTFFEYAFSAIPDIATVLFFILVIILKKPNLRKFFWQLPDFLVIFYVLLSLLLGLVHPIEYKLALYDLRLSFLPVLFYFAFRLLSHEEIKSLFISLTYFLLIFATLAILLYLFFPTLYFSIHHKLNLPYDEYFIPRLFFLIWSPVVMGSLMFLGFLLTIFLIRSFFRWISLIIFSVAITCTVSRGAILGLLITLTFIFIFFKNYRLKVFYSLIIFLVTLSVLSLYFTSSLKLFTWPIYSTLSLVTSISQEKRASLYHDNFSYLYNSLQDSSDKKNHSAEVKATPNNSSSLNNNLQDSSDKKNHSAEVKATPNNSSSLNNSLQDSSDKKNHSAEVKATLNDLLFGHGFGKGGHIAYRFLQNDSSSNIFIKSTDCYYLKILIETGLIGLLVFFIVWSWIFFWMTKHSLKTLLPLNILSTSTLLFVLLQNLVSNTMDFYFFAHLFWASLGSFKMKNYA